MEHFPPECTQTRAKVDVPHFELVLTGNTPLQERFTHTYVWLNSLRRRERRRLMRMFRASLVLVALWLALTGMPLPARAAVLINVTANSGINPTDGICSLAEAIISANTLTPSGGTAGECPAGDAAGTTIQMPGSPAIFNYAGALSTYGDTALPEITSKITIEGSGRTIRRDPAASTEFRILWVKSGGDLTLNNLTLSGGKGISPQLSGGAILNAGTLAITGSTLSGNESGWFGGAILNSGSATVTGSTLSGNLAAMGGGINNYYGTLSVINSTISGNTVSGNPSTFGGGGGIYNSQGTALITNSTISGNTANNSKGGGIINHATVTGTSMTITRSTISGNHALGLHGSGGGIENNGALTLGAGTISGNDAPWGAGVELAGGTVTLTNCTFSGNQAAYGGGGVYSHDANATLTNCTITGNQILSPTGNGGGGVYQGQGSGSLTLHHTIISGNDAPDGKEIKRDSITTEAMVVDDFNLFGHSGETDAQAFSNFTPGASDLNATSSSPAPFALSSILNTTLASNGGPTLTHNPVPGSPAIDKLNSAACAAAPVNGVDQRGAPRPFGAMCDIGAVEYGATAPSAVTLSAFHAAAVKQGVRMKWQTANEVNVIGFNVWRQAGKGDWKMLNKAQIAAKQTGKLSGDKYSQADKTAKSDPDKNHPQTYRYKIEIVFADGHSEWSKMERVAVK